MQHSCACVHRGWPLIQAWFPVSLTFLIMSLDTYSVSVLMKSNLSIFLFLSWILVSYLRAHCQVQRSWTFTPMFSSKSFIVWFLYLGFWSILSYFCTGRTSSLCGNPVVQDHLRRRTFIPHWMKSVDHRCFRWGFICFHKMIVWFFLLHAIHSMCDCDRLSYVESPLYSWTKSLLVRMCNPFNILLDAIC